MNKEEAEEYAKNMTYRDAVCNALQGKCVPYRKATLIKLYELLDRLEQDPCEDAISRQAVLDKKELVELEDGQSFYCISPEDVETLSPVNPQPRTEWIPVSERLPELTDDYLVTVGINEYGIGMIRSVRTALYNAKTKDWTIHTGTNMCIVGDVVAWCDCLPEPYKTESENS